MISKWMTKRQNSAYDSFAPLAPEAPFAAIGDIHGRVDLLGELLARIDPDLPVICVGDYVDRGEHSAEVLHLLHARPDITCILGNHEDMLLSFLKDPEEKGPRWLRYGGLQTLASFGVKGVTETAPPMALRTAAKQLKDAMGEEMIAWLDEMPELCQTGNVVITHAGANPAKPIDEQNRRTLLWGHPEFRKTPREDGLWIVHGHTIVDMPVAEAGRIPTDTGAYATGRLTAAIIYSNGVEFVST